jgi:hypothetical protein
MKGMDAKPRITIRSIMLATLWVGVALGSGLFLAKREIQSPSAIGAALSLLMLGSPFVAIDALRGRNQLAFSFGTFVLVVFLFVWGRH